MKRRFNWFRKGTLFGLNVGILVCLFLVGTIVFYGPQSLRGQEQLIIPDDSLVYEGKLLELNLTKVADQLILEGQGEAKVYLAKTDTEVLSNATVQLEISTLSFKTNLSEVSSGVYSVTLPENLTITPEAEGVSAVEIADWKIQPLEYSLSVNNRTKSSTLHLSPIKISTLESGLDLGLKTSLLETKVVDYIPTAGISTLSTTPKTYELFVKTTFMAKVLDIDGVPIANQTLTVALELPNHTYVETVTVTTDAGGSFSYSRTEKALLTVSGGQIITLASPLQIEGTSFPVMILNWGGGGGGGGGRDPKDDEVDPEDDPENNGKPESPEDEEAADPINITTGNMYHTHQDLYIPGKGLPLNFTRTYNSRDTYEGPLGYGWTHSYNIFLKEDSSGNVRERDEDGSLIIFTKNPDGSYSSPAGNYDSLTKDSNGYTLRRKYGTIYNFNTTGKLTSIIDPNSNQTTLTYTGNKLTTITDASGRQITLTYDSSSRITTLTDPLGRQTTYSYDSKNNLISYADSLGNTTEYSYTEEDYDDDHNLTKITDARGNNTYITYDDKHRAISFSNEGDNNKITLSYDPDNKKTTVTDSKGNETIYYYTIISDIRKVTKIIDPKGNTQELEWDSDLNKISYTDQNGHTTNMNYDSQGNQVSSTDPLGNTTSFTYELTYNQITSITDALGYTTLYEYDLKGNLIKVTDAKSNNIVRIYDSSGNMTSMTDANGNSTYYDYDTYGNLIKITDALNNQTNFSYDLVGNCTQITDAKGNITSFVYDDLNRLVETTYPDVTKVTYTYDEVGNRTSITDPKGNVTTYEYDVVNRLYKVLDSLGGQTNYGYDTEGNRVGITDADRNTTRYSYDELNRLIETITPLLKKTEFSYDPAGNHISQTDANGNTINYAYDACNRLTQITYPDASTVSFTYDATGKRISMTDNQGTTTYTYDELNRLIEVDGPDTNDTITYSYDNVGNRISMVDQDGGITTYEYDPLNRLITLTSPQAETITYTYDEVNNLAQMNYPNSTQTTYSYDNLNRLINLVNKRTASTPSQKEIISSYSYQYDDAGMRTKVTMDDGDYVLYSYDKLNRLTKEMKKKGNLKRTFFSYSYAYDPAGNRTSMTRRLYQRMTSAGKGGKDSGAVSPGLGVEDLPGINNYTYAYNKDNQLLAIDITRSARKSIPPSNPKKASNFKAGEILVKFKPGTDEQTISNINAKHGTTVIKKINKLGVLKLKISSGVDPQKLATAYQSEPEVEYAEPNFLIHTLLTPNDLSFTQQWGLNNTGQTGGTPDSDIDASEAWDIETGDPSLVIAIVDTGVDFDHPDLAGKVIPGHDFVNDDDDAQDDHGHGTFVAGIAAAVTDNNTGVAGVCWYSQILPVKVMDSSGTGDHGDVADGIIYAADNGAHIINLSIGDPDPSTTLENAIKYAYDIGVVLVAGAGNDNGPVLYPAAYDGYVLSVAATDHNDERAPWSNYGPEIDVAAPGVNIYSTHWNDTYATKSGTSTSTPFVSGLAGLILSQNPNLTPGQVMNQIKSTCQDVNQASLPGEDDYLGAGRINAYNALAMAIVPPQKEVIHATIEYAYDNNGNQIKKTINKAKGNPSVFNYTYDYENRLITITYPDGTTSEYVYDGVGKRIMSTEESEVAKYLYDGLNAIIERNLSGDTTAYYARGLDYGGGIGSIISAVRGGNTSYYHYDGLGNVANLTDSAAKTIQSYAYDAFGNILTQKGLVQNPYGFSTKEYNSKSGLIYFGMRYYDPRIGRFITKDPLEMVKGAHPYVYCNNNPINYLDHWGAEVGDKYPTQDAAAKDALNDIYGPSVKKDREYGGYIYQNKDGTYSYTKAKKGEQHGISDLGPKPSTATADYHSHGAESGPAYDDENFSPTDKKDNRNTGLDGYLVTPSGQMKKYDPSSDTVSDIGKVDGKK